MSEMACPDPSAHEASHKSKLSEQASSAALYVTDPARSTRGARTSDSRADILDADGKLSSRSRYPHVHGIGNGATCIAIIEVHID